MDDSEIPEIVIKALLAQQRRMRGELPLYRSAVDKARSEVAAKEKVFEDFRAELFELSEFLNKHLPVSMRLDDSEELDEGTNERAMMVGSAHKQFLRVSSTAGLVGSVLASRKNIGFFGGGDPVVDIAPLLDGNVLPGKYSGSEIKKVVTDAALLLLANGKRLTTGQIAEALATHGVMLEVASPTTRISQILSDDMQFATARGVGWWIKGVDPAVTGSTSAT